MEVMYGLIKLQPLQTPRLLHIFRILFLHGSFGTLYSYALNTPYPLHHFLLCMLDSFIIFCTGHPLHTAYLLYFGLHCFLHFFPNFDLPTEVEGCVSAPQFQVFSWTMTLHFHVLSGTQFSFFPVV